MVAIASMRDVLDLEAETSAQLPPSTYELFRIAAARHADAPALSSFGSVAQHRHLQTWSYRELFAKVTQTANFFHWLGATPRSVIAFVLPNLLETHAVLWGAEATGIVLPLNPLLEGSALAELLNGAGVEILVSLAPAPGSELWPKLELIAMRVPSLKHLVLVDLSARLKNGSAVVQLHSLAKALPQGVIVHDFAASIASESAMELVSQRRISASEPASWYCTGGTTGQPKLAVRTHGNEVANAWSLARALGDTIGPGKSLFCGLPLFHVNAGLVTGLLPFWRGAHVLLGTPLGYRDPELLQRFWEIVAHHRINFFSGVPTLYASLLEVPIAGHDVSSLEYGLCGAAPMPSEVFHAFEARTGLRILEGYGLTEATCVSSVNPPGGERRSGSIGLRLPGQLMKPVVLDEQGQYVRDCALDEVGVLVVSGANVFLGYRDTAHNEKLWIDCGDGLRWLNTGDLGRVDHDGYFWLVGRRKELIIRGGHNIDPAAIEEPLHRHPAVAIAAAVGRPDPYAGEVPVVYVQLRPGASVSEAELIRYLRYEISERAALPKHVHIIDRMPLTAIGKIYKPALKRLEAKDALECALRQVHVEPRTLTIVDDSVRGTMANLEIERAAMERARCVLGQFALPFSISDGLS
jgi:fatty-acyl-CoA synthase